MTTMVDRAEILVEALEDAKNTKPVMGAVDWRWTGDALPEGAAWLHANADVLPLSMDISWFRMDNGHLLKLRTRDAADLVGLLAVAYALGSRFKVGVSTYQPAGVPVVGVSCERIYMNGNRIGGLCVDFSGSVRMAVAS